MESTAEAPSTASPHVPTPVSPPPASAAPSFAQTLRDLRQLCVAQTRKIKEQAETIRANEEHVSRCHTVISEQLEQLKDLTQKLDAASKEASGHKNLADDRLTELLRLTALLPTDDDHKELEIAAKAIADAKAFAASAKAHEQHGDAPAARSDATRGEP